MADLQQEMNRLTNILKAHNADEETIYIVKQMMFKKRVQTSEAIEDLIQVLEKKNLWSRSVVIPEAFLAAERHGLVRLKSYH